MITTNKIAKKMSSTSMENITCQWNKAKRRIEYYEKIQKRKEKKMQFPTSFVKSDLYKQDFVLFPTPVWRLCKSDLKVSTQTLRPDSWEKRKEIQKNLSFSLNSLRKSQLLVHLSIILKCKLVLILVDLSIKKFKI
jgi:hypothetical protein